NRERDRLANAQALQALAARGYAVLYEDDGAVIERLGDLQREAQGWAKLDTELEEIDRRLAAAAAEVKDIAHTRRDLGERWEADPARLEDVERRIQLLRRLETKYRKSVDDLILYRVTLDEQERKLQEEEDSQEGLQEEAAEAYAKLKEAAAAL